MQTRNYARISRIDNLNNIIKNMQQIADSNALTRPYIRISLFDKKIVEMNFHHTN